MTKEIIAELDNAGTSLTQMVSSFENETFNKVPFPGSWTPAQVAAHILKSLSGIPEIICGKTKSTQRTPNENEEPIKNLFLNFDIKMQSPDFILPENKIYNKERLLNALQTGFEKIKDAVQASDLSATCLDFEFPGFGYLTRQEWAYFAVYHTQRHTHQLKKIRQKLTNSN